ncbi:DM13 domain-containing protein [Tolypothrix sp. FACHB-123]|uniref:DM13 domain-containing protein n=1 Tax=Tolypothrix sp. FACHB-123 TaxID=2692868 RepID=UPI001689E64D|nr:DM13 domain-containing protein [Tolypothrix sp. FACHB-123]MBD2354875.1 DM13 domain-containing protein [Tolypothrix sp. FACHB-123]
MRFKHLAIVSLIAAIAIGCTNENTPNSTDSQTTPKANVATSAGGFGAFKAGEHPTQGKVQVITEQGKRYLEFDGDFKTDKGPDLYVILYRSDAPPKSGIKEKDYVSLARLQKTSGTQRYAVPETVKLGEFKSVAIWCRKFNATFGYASLASI